MGALDGNNSLKRFVREGQQHSVLKFSSDYFLSQDYVDRFKNEVKRKAQAPGVVEIEGDPTDSHAGKATCTERWRAANADHDKGMYNTFHETGIFISVCRHGFIWTIADMVRSGEL